MAWAGASGAPLGKKKKDGEGGGLVSDQRECGGWVSPASTFLLLAFTPRGCWEIRGIGSSIARGKNAA